MEAVEASISWRIGHETHEKKVMLRNNKLLLSQYFLQCLLPPACKFLALKAIIQVGSESLEVVISSEWDIDGNEHYVLDSTLSKRYVMEHSSALMYISDSEDIESSHKNGESMENSVQRSLQKAACNYINLDNEPFPIPNQTSVNLSSSEEGLQNKKTKSIITWICEKQKCSRLENMINCSKEIKQVKEIPQHYDGDIVFELPPVFESTKRMEGMEQRFDGHLWTRPQKTNMSIDCTVRLSYCLGSLVCHRITCPYFVTNKKFNVSFFHGYLDRQVSKGLLCDDEKNSISCHYCKKIVFCEEPCSCKVYYILPSESAMNRLMVHIGHHSHEVQSGTSRAAIERIRKMVATVLKVDRHNGPRKVQMIVARQLLVDAIIGRNEAEMGDTELSNILEEMIPLVQNQRFKTIVAVEKRLQAFITGDGYDHILQLKRKCLFPFFHESRFPGQGGPNDKCFIFKMSTKGPGSGVDLVNRMRQTGQGDLSAAWIHFDYTHRIDGWATMSCSVYDPSLKGLMVIAVCDTKEEDTETQILFWNCLNEVLCQQGCPRADFAGFMSDEAGANWAAIRTVFNGGPDNMIVGRERSCLFHWEQSLQKHSKKLVRKEKLQVHLDMCEAWRNSPTLALAKEQANNIRRWWEENVAEENIKPLERWFKWWETRIAHWGNLNPQISLSPWEKAQIPNTNLSESIHASWLAGEGGKRKISLYDACVTDVINAYIQCTKQHGFLTGRYLGTGPDMHNFLERVATKRTPSPCVVARVVQGAMAGTQMYEQPVLHGDKETVQRKKTKGSTTDTSHKPGYVMESRQRKERGRPRKISFESGVNFEEQYFDVNAESTDEGNGDNPQGSDTPIVGEFIGKQKEVFIHKGNWAIRRMPPNCVRKCFGMVQGNRCLNIMQSRSPGLVGPCFWGERTYKSQSQHQWMWFCNHDVVHSRVVARQVLSPPETPTTWLIENGTNVNLTELASLVGAGFVFDDSTCSIENMQKAESSGKRSKKWRSGVSKAANKRLETAATLHAELIEEIIVVHNRHVVFKIYTQDYYNVHVKDEPFCTCPDFQRRETEKKPYLACKHLYFVYTQILGLDRNQHMIIHQPALSERDLTFILSQARRVAPVKK